MDRKALTRHIFDKMGTCLVPECRHHKCNHVFQWCKACRHHWVRCNICYEVDSSSGLDHDFGKFIDCKKCACGLHKSGGAADEELESNEKESGSVPKKTCKKRKKGKMRKNPKH